MDDLGGALEVGDVTNFSGSGALEICLVCPPAVLIEEIVEVRIGLGAVFPGEFVVLTLGVTEELVLVLLKDPFLNTLPPSSSSSSPSFPCFFFFFDFFASNLTLTPVQSWGAFI